MKNLEYNEIASRYAKALYELAAEAGTLDAVRGDLENIRTLLTTAADLSQALASPLMTHGELTALGKLIGTQAKASPLTMKFLGVLAARRRLILLPSVIDAFLARQSREKGERHAEVILAVQPDAAQAEAIRKQLTQSLGGAVQMDVTINPAILGGMIVRTGATMVDASVRGKLERLRRDLKRAA